MDAWVCDLGFGVGLGLSTGLCCAGDDKCKAVLPSKWCLDPAVPEMPHIETNHAAWGYRSDLVMSRRRSASSNTFQLCDLNDYRGESLGPSGEQGNNSSGLLARSLDP